MLFLHIIMFTFNYDLINQINELPAINIVALIVLPYLGGLAGFFLVISAIGNMISMYRHLQSGKSVRDLVVKQVVGGIILLIFAVLTESMIGYHGALGEAIRLNPNAMETILWRGYHMETIHTIAWCVILNGVVQGFLSRHDGWKDHKRLIKVYAVLAIVVVGLTPLMWKGAQAIVQGYPYERYRDVDLFDSGRRVQYPLEGYSTVGDYITLFFLAPIAGAPEPIFPYLAVSFIGSIVGILLSQERKKIPRNFPRRSILLGFTMFLIGAAGLIINYVMLFESAGIDAVLETYRGIWDHRSYFSLPVGGWLFQFLCLNGTALCVTMLVIRLVEFRGKGVPFGKKSLFIRRYGYVAFTIYNCQFLFFIPHLLITLLAGLPPYASFGWKGVFLIEVLGILFIQGVLLLWERGQYVGTLKWWIGILGNRLNPVRRKEEGGWKLDVQGVLHEPEWVNIVEEREVAHREQAESKLAWKLSILGFLFFPLAIVAYFIAKESRSTEKENRVNRRAEKVSMVAIVFAVAWIIFLSLFTPADLGISI